MEVEHEAQYVVEQILRLRDASDAAAAGGGHKSPSPAPPHCSALQTNAQSMAFERRLVREGVPPSRRSALSYARKVRDAIAYLQLPLQRHRLARARDQRAAPRHWSGRPRVAARGERSTASASGNRRMVRHARRRGELKAPDAAADVRHGGVCSNGGAKLRKPVMDSCEAPTNSSALSWRRERCGAAGGGGA